MDKTFMMSYENEIYILFKDDVKIKNDLGVVRAFTMDDDNEPLIGLVDKNYNTILELRPTYFMPKLDVLDNDVVVTVAPTAEFQDGYCSFEVLIGKFNGYDIGDLYNVHATNYEVINDRVIKLIFFTKGSSYEVLYDVIKEETISPYVNSIGEYQNHFGKMLARAELLVNFNDTDFRLCFLIDEKGIISSPFYELNYEIIINDTNNLEVALKILENSYSR